MQAAIDLESSRLFPKGLDLDFPRKAYCVSHALHSIAYAEVLVEASRSDGLFGSTARYSEVYVRTGILMQ